MSAALRHRDRDAVRVLRTVLAAVANAEAQPYSDETPTRLRADGPIAGSTGGLGAAEVARRDLDPDTILAIVAGERDERLAAADDLAGRGAYDAAGALLAEATLLERYLG
ncbi:hypothetical protein EKO23_11945 [Nocardioides guangzhouensis]|uniref:Uncharacterized protein n=1 Tax=Nocardioides guangzhouensis TaxID=2497878 RepID=A0A4Q4ZCF6_9ACTN|nr:hypothetical protein EKO23_11945 [Nocardioides guangzhouensis]